MRSDRRKMGLACAAGLLAWLALPAIGQKADRPVVHVGDEWRFAMYYGAPTTVPTRVWVIRSVGLAAIEGTENGLPLLLTPELNVLESPRQKDSDPHLLRFPMEVGRRWSYTSEWVFGSVIDADFVLTYWYAPTARVVVKSISRNPYLGTSTVELVSFHPMSLEPR